MEKKMWRDLGLTYGQALHAVQTAVMHRIGTFKPTLGHSEHDASPKHLRVGVNSAMASHGALAFLLLKKGLFTQEEYAEEVRLAMNDELAQYEEEFPNIKFR